VCAPPAVLPRISGPNGTCIALKLAWLLRCAAGLIGPQWWAQVGAIALSIFL